MGELVYPGDDGLKVCPSCGDTENMCADPESCPLDQKFQVVSDLAVPLIREREDGTTYTRPSVANASWLIYIAENDRDGGVGMDEIMREFGLNVMAQGRVAIAMKDSVEMGMAEQVAPRGDQYRWRITEKGLEAVGLERVMVTPPPDPDELKLWMVEQHGRSNVTLLRAEMNRARRAAGLPLLGDMDQLELPPGE